MQALFIKEQLSLCVDTSQGLGVETIKGETSLRWTGQVFQFVSLTVTVVFTSTTTSRVSMSHFPALSLTIPLGMRADCSLIEEHGWCACFCFFNGLLCFGKWDPGVVARQLWWHLRWCSVGWGKSVELKATEPLLGCTDHNRELLIWQSCET